MANEKEVKPQPELHDYAGGWIQERKGTEVPTFLKASYVVVVLGAILYSIVYVQGEVDHPDRGVLVKQFNAATDWSPALSYGITGLVVIFFVILLLFAFRKGHGE